MFSRTDRDAGSDDERFSERLSTLKRQGASVLVVGSVRTTSRRNVWRRLLGRATAQPRRRILVSTTGDSDTLDLSQLDETGLNSSTVERVRYAAQTRSATATAPETGPESPSAGPQPTNDVPTSATTLTELGVAISSAVETFDAEANGLEPAQLRIGVDSLVPLLEEYGTGRIFKFVHLTNARAREADGMVQYHLPTDRDADVVTVLEPLFDIVVELRECSDGFQERWSITDSDHDSGWISIDQS